MNQPMNRAQKRMLAKQGQLSKDGSTAVPAERPRSRPGAAAKQAEEKASFRRYLGEIVTEMKRVSWPTRSEIINYSLVVLVTLVVLMSAIAGIDAGLSRAALYLFK